jgi:hypothetical protein
VSTTSKPPAPILAMHSTSSLGENNFHNSNSVQSKQSANSFGLEHGKLKNKSSPENTGPDKDDSSQTSLDTQTDNLNPGRRYTFIQYHSHIRRRTFYYP